jgi:hypothetical protein
MALSNYSELRASVALWLNRSDLTDVIPDFIALTESDLSKRLRVPQNETMLTAFALTGRYTTLPTDFAEMRRVYLNYGSDRVELVPLPQAGRSSETGIPTSYNIVNNTLEVVPTSTSYTLEISYWKVIPPLSTNNTNAILTNYPELYIYGACSQAGFWLADDSVIGKFVPRYEQGIIVANSKKHRQMGQGLQVRAS